MNYQNSRLLAFRLAKPLPTQKIIQGSFDPEKELWVGGAGGSTACSTLDPYATDIGNLTEYWTETGEEHTPDQGWMSDPEIDYECDFDC